MKNQTQKLREACQKQFNNYYNYSKTIYKRSREKVIIICPMHGEFEQTPEKHLLKLKGCPNCPEHKERPLFDDLREVLNLRYDEEYFRQITEKSNLKYINFFIKRNSSRERIVIHCQNQYGQLHLDYYSLLQHKNPTIESAIDPSSYFKNYYYDKYPNSLLTFPLNDYVNSRTKIKVVCGYGHTIYMTPSSLVKGSNCNICGSMLTASKFKSFCKKDSLGLFYILRCYNKQEEFYKLGITSQGSVQKRYPNEKYMPYKYEIIQEIYFDAELVFYLEEFLKNFIVVNGLHYVPLIPFGGHLHECFKYD